MVAGVSLALAAVETILLEATSTVPYRAISTIMADVTVEEQHTDNLTATKHPVELGAAITDHCYKEPSQLTIRAGWSDSGNYDGYVEDVYAALLNLQASRQYFNIYTGKRVYQNMLMLGLSTVTDQKTEFSMLVVARFEEIIIASTQTTTLPPSASQSQPQNTAPPQNSGTQQTQTPTPQNTSLLFQAGQSIGGTN